MPDKWVKVDKGIRYRVHPTRKHGIGPDKYYVLRFTVDGKKVQESLGWASSGITLEKARLELAKLKEANRTGEGPVTLNEKRQLATAQRKAEEVKQQLEAKAAITLSDYFEKTYKPWALTTKPKAFRREDSLYRTWLLPAFGHLPLRDIHLEQWDHLVQTLTNAKRSERSREYATGTLRRILKHALERKVIKEAPPPGRVIGSTAPKNNRRLRVLESYELTALLAELEQNDLCAWRITLFAAITGCRFGELAALTWGNVNLVSKSVTFAETKNNTRRIIPIESNILRLLQGIPPGNLNDRVFVTPQGRPYSDCPASFRAAVDRLGLNEGRSARERFTFHSLRHGAATALAQRMSLRDLMDYMGWKVAAMALRYTHSDESVQRAALVELERLVLDTGEQTVG